MRLTVQHCAGCGYLRDYHDPGTTRCPDAKKAVFRVPPPPDLADYRQIMQRDADARRRAIDDARRPYRPPAVPPPMVPARLPRGPQEFAGGTADRAGVHLGRLAIGRGWSVEPWYWRAGDGAEGCALKLARGSLRAVAVWRRPSADFGKLTGWVATSAFHWPADGSRFPIRVTHTDLERMIHDD